MSDLMTASRARSARACMRHHEYRYERGMRPVTDDAALRFGTLIHLGLEAWMLAKADRAAAAFAAVQVESDPFERAKAEALLLGYDARWGDEPLDVLEVEGSFRLPLLGSWDLGGKRDGIVRDRRTGRVFVIEHKTTTEAIEPGSDYWRRLRLDSQVSIYIASAREQGFDVDACLYDVIGKPRLRPLKATPPDQVKRRKDGEPYAGQRLADETPDEYRARLIEAIEEDPAAYYQRLEVPRFPEELAETRSDLAQLTGQIMGYRLAGRWPRNPDACHRYGRFCEYHAVCCGEASLDDPCRFVAVPDVHPELADASPSRGAP